MTAVFPMPGGLAYPSAGMIPPGLSFAWGGELMGTVALEIGTVDWPIIGQRVYGLSSCVPFGDLRSVIVSQVFSALPAGVVDKIDSGPL